MNECKWCNENIPDKMYVGFYLKGWKKLIWRIFIRYVYKDWQQGWDNHNELIEKGYIIHLTPNQND